MVLYSPLTTTSLIEIFQLNMLTYEYNTTIILLLLSVGHYRCHRSLTFTEILTLWHIMSLVSLDLVLLMVMTRIMTRMIIINFSDIDF